MTLGEWVARLLSALARLLEGALSDEGIAALVSILFWIWSEGL